MQQLTVTFDLTAENLEKLKAFCQEAGVEMVSKKSAAKDKKEEPKTKASKQAAAKEAKTETPKQEVSKQEDTEQKVSESAAAKAITKTDVRAVALKLSKAGMSDTLKSIFAKFDASKLSEVPEECYADLMDELMAAEVNKNA